MHSINDMTPHSITYVKVPSSSAATWKVKGSPWSTQACPWLIAHDLFHHLPGDRGSIAEELASVGAEFYVNIEQDGMLDVPSDQHHPNSMIARSLLLLVTNAGSIVGMAFDEGSAEPGQFFIPADSGGDRLTSTLEQLFAECAKEAVDMLAEHVEGDEGWDEALENFLTANVAALMRKGYLSARSRFPDREAVREAFATAVHHLSQISDVVDGAELTVTRCQMAIRTSIAHATGVPG